ncbi:TolC family protein [Edaphobacter aggregans]|uniref:TolC family protein n=1 Tax=Edaphobacter aggregans TaxID=570835 RepID=UPI000555C45A|nr:TolC family protein [Edaphobacter aggregans]
MKSTHLLLVLTMLAFASPIRSPAQLASADGTQVPLLTLDDAVSLALTNNRLVKNSSLEAEKYDFRVNTIRSRRLPHFQFSILGGELLQPFDFTFPPGVFGTYPGIGPVPATNAKVHTPAQFITYTTAGLDEPLTQQYKIHLAIRATELGRDIAREDVRSERQKIANEVRTAYFEIVATQAAVDAVGASVKTLQEAQRLTARYRVEKTVLHSDVLEIDARLAKARYELSTAEDGLTTQREHLNQLLGRDITTAFRVDLMPEDDPTDLTLGAARHQASQNRPEIRQAQLKEKQAEYDRRLAKAEYIPDLGLSVQYLGINNVPMLPSNVAVAGFLLTWEPFDWGRRHNAVAERTRTKKQASYGIQETEAQIAVEVGMKYRKWKDAALLLKAARIGHEAAAEQFRVTSNKYGEQAALLKDVLQAQAHSSEAGYQYQQALSSYWSALANLRRSMGEE